MQLGDNWPHRGTRFEQLQMALLALHWEQWEQCGICLQVGHQNYDSLLEEGCPNFSLVLTARFGTAQVGLRSYRDIGLFSQGDYLHPFKFLNIYYKNVPPWHLGSFGCPLRDGQFQWKYCQRGHGLNPNLGSGREYYECAHSSRGWQWWSLPFSCVVFHLSFGRETLLYFELAHNDENFQEQLLQREIVICLECSQILFTTKLLEQLGEAMRGSQPHAGKMTGWRVVTLENWPIDGWNRTMR